MKGLLFKLEARVRFSNNIERSNEKDKDKNKDKVIWYTEAGCKLESISLESYRRNTIWTVHILIRLSSEGADATSLEEITMLSMNELGGGGGGGRGRSGEGGIAPESSKV